MFIYKKVVSLRKAAHHLQNRPYHRFVIMERTVSTKVKKINHKKLLTNFMPLNDPNAFIHNTEKVTLILRRGADKFLARPGRKQATATKLGIYSTHSPRSSINILNRCSNFCKPLKKNQNTVHPTRSTRQQ